MNLKQEMIKILKRGISCGLGEDIISVEDALTELESLCKDYAREQIEIFKNNTKVCSDCNGDGWTNFVFLPDCDKCNGTGIYAPLPEELKGVEEADLIHKCGDCGVNLTLIRPGKYQCNNCE